MPFAYAGTSLSGMHVPSPGGDLKLPGAQASPLRVSGIAIGFEVEPRHQDAGNAQ